MGIISGKNELGNIVPDTKAQIMSRRVWEILLLLPTNPEIKSGLQEVDTESDMTSLLDPHCPHKLLYTFYIIDWLGRPARLRRQSGLVTDSNPAPESSWVSQFILSGGLGHLFSIFLSGVLGRGVDSAWCEWKQDCLGSLLRLLVQFGVDQADSDLLADQLAELGQAGGRRRVKWGHRAKTQTSDKMMVARLSTSMLDLMMTHNVMLNMGRVFTDISRGSVKEGGGCYRTGMFGRGQIVHFAMSLLVSWVYSSNQDLEESMISQSEMRVWLKQLLLEDPDPSVRREMCTGVYRLCLGNSSQGRTGSSLLAPILSILLQYFDHAQMMKPQRRESINHSGVEEPGKEPFGPACRDYFWVLCKLVENLKLTEDTMDLVDIECLAMRLYQGITGRPFYERRQGGNSGSPDDALIGMLNLMSAVLKHNPDFKQQPVGQELVEKLFMVGDYSDILTKHFTLNISVFVCSAVSH